MKARVEKVIYHLGNSKYLIDPPKRGVFVLYEDFKFKDNEMSVSESVWGSEDTLEFLANSTGELWGIEFHILATNGRKYIRQKDINIKKRERDFDYYPHDDVPRYSTLLGEIHYTYTLADYKKPVLKIIEGFERGGFILTEHELIEEVQHLLAEDHKIDYFKTQVEIGGRIIDGLAFVKRPDNGSDFKIIGFEVKANTDNYNRLYDQVDGYLAICDEVYLVIQDKKIPSDLPFYVGIIRVQKGLGIIEREATSLKHSIDQGEYWKTLLNGLAVKLELNGKKAQHLIDFFTNVENIKRKLVYNQFGEGFHQTYVNKYLQLDTKEKQLLHSFFNLNDNGGLS